VLALLNKWTSQGCARRVGIKRQPWAFFKVARGALAPLKWLRVKAIVAGATSAVPGTALPALNLNGPHHRLAEPGRAADKVSRSRVFDVCTALHRAEAGRHERECVRPRDTQGPRASGSHYGPIRRFAQVRDAPGALVVGR
jgi:hypothetical protein